jgi:hypothetical protein
MWIRTGDRVTSREAALGFSFSALTIEISPKPQLKAA